MTEQGRKIFNMVLALIVATAAWFFVVYNYDPMTDVKYSDVPIRYTGLVTLANRGYAVSEASSETVDIRLKQKRIETGNITSDDISVTADVSSLSSGENTVTLTVSGPDGTSVDDVSLKTVTVDIESADSEEMEISIEYPGQNDEDSEPIVEDMSVAYATVIATEDRFTKIDRVAAVVDPDELGEKLKPLTVQLAALDEEGNKVLNVVIEPETVSFKVAAGRTKEVSLITTVTDTSDDSYERTYTAPQTITVKGSKDLLDMTSSIQANEIDISYVYEDTEIPLEYVLPEGLYIANGSQDLVLDVKVTEKTETTEEENSD